MLWYAHVFDRAVRWDLVLLFNIVQLVVGENNRVAKVEEDDKRCNRLVVRKAITISSSKEHNMNSFHVGIESDATIKESLNVFDIPNNFSKW